MQFPNKILVSSNAYNENGEALPTKTTPMSCRVLSDDKKADDSDGAKTNKYDLVILTNNTSFAPYNEMFSDETLTFQYLGRNFRLKASSAIVDFAGKTKFYEIGLKQVK